VVEPTSGYSAGAGLELAAQGLALAVGVAVDQMRTMLAMFSSEPASQYCRVRK
jgi:hypothetical protein